MVKRIFTVVLITALLAFSSCSVKKNSFKNRAYHNMTSWFNTLFNGQVAMDEKLEENRNSFKDDYFEILPVEAMSPIESSDETSLPVAVRNNPRGNAGVFGKVKEGNLLSNDNSNATGFEKAEEKALKAIEKHSMLIRNEERNKLISRSYLMLGQARYYMGKPFQAMDALQQVQQLPFDKHHADAKYYTALAQIQAGNKYAAAEILDELYENEDLKKQLTADVAKHYAMMYLQEGDEESALNGLDKAIKFTKSRKEKARLNYIQGQILTQMGRWDEAIAKFQKVYKLKPGFEMEARSVVAAAMNFDPMVHDYQGFKNKLMKAYNTGTYETYQNEFLYALGNIELKRDSLSLAETTFKKALAKEQSDARFRAETYAAMGKLKFNRSDYVYAGAYYDSAVSVIQGGKRKEELTKFRDDLKGVMDKYYLVQRNDSILRLVAMTDTEKETYFMDFIEELKKKDELKRQEEEQAATQFLTQSKDDGFGSGFDNKGGKFYFYSNAAKSNGENEFRRIWGNVSLKDNWRLSSSGTSIADQKAELTGTSDLSNPRRYDLDFYLEKIPSKKSEITHLKIERDTVELSLGIDYFDKFKDAKLATTTLEHLVETPPKEEEVLLKAYYNLYRFNADKNPNTAQNYKDIILNEYPTSLYAEFILNPNKDFTEENNPEVLALYRETYDAYKAENYQLVKQNTVQAMNDYPMAKIMAKFSLLNAYADAALSGKEAYRAGLERVLILYPDTDEATHAQYLLDLLDGKKKTAKTKEPKKAKNSKKEAAKKVKKEKKRKLTEDEEFEKQKGMTPNRERLK